MIGVVRSIPAPRRVFAAGKKTTTVHLTDDARRTLCGRAMEGRWSLPGRLPFEMQDCLSCQRSEHGPARTKRYIK